MVSQLRGEEECSGDALQRVYLHSTRYLRFDKICQIDKEPDGFVAVLIQENGHTG